MVSHLKWILMRDQKPEAAASNSALLGRYRCGRWCGRRSRRCLGASGVSGCSSGAGLDDVGGALGWDEELACGAWAGGEGLFWDEPGVTELLLRRPLLLCFLSVREALDEAWRVQAAERVAVTLCWTWCVRGLGAGGKQARYGEGVM